MLARRPLAFALVLGALGLSASACSAPSSDDGSTAQGSAIVQSALDVGDVNAVIGQLDAIRTGDPIGTYYEDGARIEGCWRNPAGNKLTDLKKAFYCAMPLEFRLCNTIVLLTTDEAKVSERYQGYVDCQTKVDAVFGSKGLFKFGADVDAMYQKLFLDSATLSAEDTSSVVAANKPAFSSHSFAVILLAIARSLAKEAVDIAARGLTAMADDVKTESGDDPR
jgi:hypothetical protein